MGTPIALFHSRLAQNLKYVCGAIKQFPAESEVILLQPARNFASESVTACNTAVARVIVG
jgi:hypothetical protein